MMIFITTLHVFLCLILVLVILLQPGKGGDVASAFGGGASSTLFGPRGPASLLTRATTIVALLFMTTSIVLAVRATNERRGTGDDLQDDIQKFEEQEATKEPAAPGPALPMLPTLPEEPPAPESSDETPAAPEVPTGETPAAPEAPPQP